MVEDALLGDDAALVRLEEEVLAEAALGLLVEVEHVRIPPDDAVLPRAGRVRSRHHRVARVALGAERALEDAVLAERGAARVALGVAPAARLGVERGVEHVEPALERPVADRGDDQQIARARGGDVGEADVLFLVAPQHLVALLEELHRHAARERLGPQARVLIDVACRRGERRGRGGIGQDHHRELQPLGAVDGHDPHALGALLDDRRLARLAGDRLGLEPLDEGAERRRPVRFWKRRA